MATFVLVVMDQTADDYTIVDAYAPDYGDAATAQEAALALINDMGSEIDRVCDTADARAELDIDGDVVWSVWTSNDADGPILTLVAIVNVVAGAVGRHAAADGPEQAGDAVIVDAFNLGMVYRVGGDRATLDMFDAEAVRRTSPRHAVAS